MDIPENLLGIACQAERCVGSGWCNARSPDRNWCCTLPKQHDGPHIACFAGDSNPEGHDKLIWHGNTILFRKP